MGLLGNNFLRCSNIVCRMPVRSWRCKFSHGIDDNTLLIILQDFAQKLSVAVRLHAFPILSLTCFFSSSSWLSYSLATTNTFSNCWICFYYTLNLFLQRNDTLLIAVIEIFCIYIIHYNTFLFAVSKRFFKLHMQRLLYRHYNSTK